MPDTSNMEDQLNAVYETLIEFLIGYSFQIVGAVVVLVAGVWVSRAVANAIERTMASRDVDVTLRQFIANTIRIVILVVFIMITLSQLSISITPLIAALGGVAVGASLAIQGPLANYAAGIAIILTRMYRIGDTLTVRGVHGLCHAISLAETTLIAEDGEHIVIPNGQILGEIHVNSFSFRVVEGSIGIAADADAEAAIGAIREAIGTHEAVATEPPMQVGIEGFTDYSIRLGYRFWVPTDRFFEVQYAVNLAVLKALREAGVAAPTPTQQIVMAGT